MEEGGSERRKGGSEVLAKDLMMKLSQVMWPAAYTRERNTLDNISGEGNR